MALRSWGGDQGGVDDRYQGRRVNVHHGPGTCPDGGELPMELAVFGKSIGESAGRGWDCCREMVVRSWG